MSRNVLRRSTLVGKYERLTDGFFPRRFFMCERYLVFRVGDFVLFSVLGLMGLWGLCGCQSAQTTGKDPLLGKTRLDPPATSARSVYVERQNFDESGVVPGGALVDGRKSGSGKGAQTAESETRTARYYSPDSDARSELGTESKSKSETENDAEAPFENNAENRVATARLKWRALGSESAENAEGITDSWDAENTENATERENGSRDLESDGGEYRYFYDFSVFPARRVPVGASAHTAEAREGVNEWTEGRGRGPRLSTDVARSGEMDGREILLPRMNVVQLTPDSFDPYAPHRKYERRRTEISQRLAADFDSSDFSARKLSTQNSETGPARNLASSSATDSAAIGSATVGSTAIDSVAIEEKTNFRHRRNSEASRNGWEVVFTPQSGSSGFPSAGSDFSGSQIASAPSGGESRASDAGVDAQSVVPSASVGEKVQISPESVAGEKRQDPRRVREDPVIELLDLPSR